MNVELITTVPYNDQNPGTSGLRKPVSTFRQENYVENFIQAIFNGLGSKLFGRTLVVGGDGRFLMVDVVKTIVQMAAANKVGKLVIGVDGIMSTPAVSNLIRQKKAFGGIILTASHNPGGPDGDFGIKYNISNGGPAPEAVTNAFFNESRTIQEYKICSSLKDFDFTKLNRAEFEINGRQFHVEVVDPVKDYVDHMKSIFDFPLLKSYLMSNEFKVVANGMHGVTGPYIEKILCEELGAPQDSLLNAVAKPDFGGAHPDPNMTYAKDFVDLVKNGEYHMGVAFDGDGDRNMILGCRSFFVNPSDSVAVIAANADCIPYFKSTGLKGLARSMPTSAAIDQVAKDLGVTLYEVPTGWKFFGNLMDAGKLSLCGEESFGTGSDHIREKDGIWAFLAWLSIVATRQKSVQDIVEEHWSKYGRNYYTRYDYENVEKDSAERVMSTLHELIDQTSAGTKVGEFVIDEINNFRYVDPVDESVSENQGVRVMLSDGSRIIYRLSGTGSQNATIRIYIERYVTDADNLKADPQECLKPLVELALQLSNMSSLTGRDQPTVVT